ncbi:unnamed protein product [Cladocopium goreaui]|uniref:Cyclic nucleotide-binding domain-containing protein n=1 Tax=Cladocopium goreaui TaxID=2562237 RepID=A0A9P1FYF0_9DINO|nr:unnamed protein product [Cladocopium goreaui]
MWVERVLAVVGLIRDSPLGSVDLRGGPGPLPGCCRQAAADRLSRKPPGADIRAEIAFAAGFWSNIAIETSTPYQPRALLQGTKKQHWIVLRSTFGEPFRTCTWREVQRICDTDHPETLTEVEIFCFGASSPIPCLRSCTEFKCFMIEKDEHGGEHRLDEAGSFLAIDVSDAILAHLREYDPVTDPSETIQTFVPEHPEAIVDLKQAFEDVRAWLETLGDSARVNFLSAREEPPEPLPKTGKRASPKRITTAALAESVASLTTQMQTLAAQQEALLKLSKASATHVPVQPNGGMTTASRVPDVSAGLSSPIPAGPTNLANLIGPPPRTKQPALAKATGPALPDTGEPLEQLQVEDQNVVTKALMQQSAAITSLVAHIAAGGDPVIDLQGSQSSALTLSTRGAAKREKMQQDPANGTSQYFLQVQQQLYKKMNPSKPLPRSDSDLLSAGASMTAYMEKFGGFKSRQDLGFIMWMLSHVMDAGAQGNSHLMREYVALTVACIDQPNLDGHWSMAYTLSLLEEPPNQVFCEKGTGMTAIGRPL